MWQWRMNCDPFSKRRPRQQTSGELGHVGPIRICNWSPPCLAKAFRHATTFNSACATISRPVDFSFYSDKPLEEAQLVVAFGVEGTLLRASQSCTLPSELRINHGS